MSERAFWRLTPRQFDALLQRLMAERKQADYRFGVLAAIMANQHRDRKKKALQPGDFFPSLRTGGG